MVRCKVLSRCTGKWVLSPLPLLIYLYPVLTGQGYFLTLECYYKSNHLEILIHS